MKTPDYYLPIMPYLVIKDTARFITFLKNVFNATEQYAGKRDDGTVMHAEFSIGKAVVMFTEATDTYPPFPAGMFVMVESADDLYAKGLAHGGTSLQEPGDREYGRSAGFADPFGNQWWVTQRRLS
ncbi:VOC family protein [Chryseolinea lacunae]|uniref:VOC family protein n=1 Tax=Chryseolinea lacunae TaxID=2801331 RepID=A0ABS1KPR7_9BACT|nr:VOC family protein [Chryseolinea lacunae]MBL0741222.1 VOC family protein [Chryseolinea lacunae]